MDMNRPDYDSFGGDEERAQSEAGVERTNETPDDGERLKSAISDKSAAQADQNADAEKIIDEENETEAGNDENQINETQNENQETENDGEKPTESNEMDDSAVELNETSMNQTNDEETLNQSIDNNESQNLAGNETSETAEAADTSEILQDSKEAGKKKTPEYYKKEAAKRKPKPNRFADDKNLILEEDDDGFERVRSPGPPPLEPISQVLDDADKHHRQQPRPDGDLLRINSPDRMDVTLDDDYNEILPEVDVKPTREELVAKYQAAVEERERLQNANNLLHHKLADYFRKKKTDDNQNQPLFDKSSQEQEQRYMKYLSTIETLKKQIESNKYDAEMELDEIKLKCEMREEMVEKERITFIKIKRDTGLRSISSQTGRPLTQKDVEFHLERERQKEKEVIGVRIENIKLKNQLKKKEMELKAKEEFGEGLHMIDFEQLKIENQTYNEKIEERNEELMKLKKKINNTVQILTHVKEKLKFVNGENDKEKENLSVYDEQVKKNRDVLNKMKQSRDSLRMENAKLKQNSGLLGNTVLLRDFEDCVDKNDELETRIEQLKRKHAELILNSRGIKSKISETKNDHFQ